MTKEERLEYYDTYGGKLFNARQTRLAEMEGWRNKGYFPTSNSGMTIGYGIDLAMINTVEDLVKHGINESTAKEWKKLGILGKTKKQLEVEHKNGGPSIGSLKLKVNIPDTESQKADIAIKTFQEVDKKLEKYQGKISDELYVSLSSQLHFNGGFGKIHEKGFKSGPFQRKSHATALVWKEIDDWIEKNPDGVVPNELVYSVYKSNEAELKKAGSPSNSTTYKRDSEKLLRDLGISEEEINVKIKENEDIDFEPQLDTKWKQDLFDKVKETVNAEGKPLSNEDLTIFSDQIDGMTYEEAKNEFGIVADDSGGGFSINVGPEKLRSQVNLQTTEVKTAAVKQRLEAVINDSNSTPEEIEAAKQNIIDLDENLQALKDNLEGAVYDNLIPLNPNDPRYQGETADLSFVTGGSSALIDELNSQLDDRYGEQTKDKDGNIVNVIGEDRVREGEVNLNEKAETFVGPDGKEYEYVKVDAGDKDEITTTGLLDADQGSELAKAQPGMSFEEWQERFPDGTREDYDAMMNKANENLENAGDKTYFDLRGEGAFEESFLDKMGGLSSLIGLATGAIGLGAALKDVDIPKDPKLGPAFQQRLAESKRMAQQGLTPSELAKAHNDLDSSYATGIDNIVRGSAGNRAQFMAGLGGLDVARQSALMDIAVADAQMQRQNQEKYDSMMLMNEQYEAARQAKYQDAKFKQDSAKQAAGAALAGSSISMVADAIASRQANRYNKMKTEQLMMQMGYKATKDGKSGQPKVGDGVQTSFSIFDNNNEGPDFNLLDADDQAVSTNVSNQPSNQNTGTNLINTSPLNTSSGLINTDNEIDLGTQMYDIFNTGY